MVHWVNVSFIATEITRASDTSTAAHRRTQTHRERERERRTHARTHARTDARTHTHTHTHKQTQTRTQTRTRTHITFGYNEVESPNPLPSSFHTLSQSTSKRHYDSSVWLIHIQTAPFHPFTPLEQVPSRIFVSGGSGSSRHGLES